MKNLLFGILLFTGLFATGFEEQAKCEENIQPDCYCILIYDPVCGCNDKTYGNACMAACSGITKYKSGECKTKQKG